MQYGLKHFEDESNAAFREEFKKYASARSVDDLKLDDGGIG